MLRIANSLPDFARDLVDVDRIVPHKHFLLLVDADDQTLLGNLLDCAGLWDRNFNSRLQDGRSHHEDDEEDKHDVHERSDVDVGQRDLCAAIGSGERHYRRTSSAIRADVGWRSTALAISSEKSSQRAAKSRIEPPIRL